MSGFPDFAALAFDAEEPPSRPLAGLPPRGEESSAVGPHSPPPMGEGDREAVEGASVWLTPEGITVKGDYTAADIADLDFIGGYPGLAPFVRGPYPTMYEPTRGQSVSTRDFPPPRIPTPSIGAIWPPARGACRWRSIWPPTGATIRTIPG